MGQSKDGTWNSFGGTDGKMYPYASQKWTSIHWLAVLQSVEAQDLPVKYGW